MKGGRKGGREGGGREGGREEGREEGKNDCEVHVATYALHAPCYTTIVPITCTLTEPPVHVVLLAVFWGQNSHDIGMPSCHTMDLRCTAFFLLYRTRHLTETTCNHTYAVQAPHANRVCVPTQKPISTTVKTKGTTCQLPANYPPTLTFVHARQVPRPHHFMPCPPLSSPNPPLASIVADPASLFPPPPPR